MQICTVCAFISVIELPRIPAYYPKIWDRSAYGFFTPETTGSYAILSGEDHLAFLFDESGKNVSEQNGVFNLQSGHKYTILNTEFFNETEAHISAELAYSIATIEPVGDFSQKTTYYTPVDFNRGGFTAKEKVGIGERWNGKIKINYVNGESEIISSRNGKNKYGMSVERYVIYNGKSEYPDAGTYDVHIGIQGSDKETVIKNVSVKKYTGKAITPSVDVSVDSASGTYLFKDIDYTLTYKNNINVGTATVIIKGKGTLYKYKIRAYKNVNGKKQYSEYSPQKSVKR